MLTRRLVTRARVLAGLLVVLALGLARAGDEPSWTAELGRALDRYADGDDHVGKGLAVVKKRLAAAPDDAEARLALARLLLARGEEDAALAEVERLAGAKDAATKENARALKALALVAKVQRLQAELGRTQSDLDRLQSDATDETEKAARAEAVKVEDLKGLVEVGRTLRLEGAVDTAGKPVSLEDWKGKVLLVDLWATWCPPCVDDVPNMVEVYDAYHARGYDVLGVSLDANLEKLARFTKENKAPWRQICDGLGWDGAIPKAWNVSSLPRSYLLDHEGKVRFFGVREEALRKAVKELVERAEAAKKK